MSSAQLSEQEQQAALSAASLHKAPPPPEEGKGSPVRKILIVLIIVAAIGAAAWKIHSNLAAPAKPTGRVAAGGGGAPTPVLVASVQQKTMPIYLTALGTATPYYSVTIKTRVDGQLMSVPVREGQAVKKGQLLALIDPAPYQAAVAQAQGQLIKDQANAANAQAEAQRYTALLNDGVVSKETQQSELSTAGQAEGSIAADQAAIEAAKVNLAYTRITSPIDGVVGLRQVDPGNIVHAADATGLLLVTQLQPIAVIFTLPEDQLPQVLDLVRSGKKLAVQAYDRSDTTLLDTGTLLTLDNSIDPTTGTDKVKAVFNNKSGALFPNQFVNVRLILQQRPNAIVVPASAIQTGTDGDFVFLVKQGTPPSAITGSTTGSGKTGGSSRRSGSGAAGASASGQPAAASSDADTSAAGTAAGKTGKARGPSYYVIAQPVKVDLTEGAQVILVSGLNPGDQVVIDGQERLVPFGKVIPRTQNPAPSADSQSSDSSDGSAAFGPEGAGPSEPSSNPGKRGIETGNGVRPGARGQRGPQSVTPQDGQPHAHHRAGQTGQPQ